MEEVWCGEIEFEVFERGPRMKRGESREDGLIPL
jgi:hypothetical protein